MRKRNSRRRKNRRIFAAAITDVILASVALSLFIFLRMPAQRYRYRLSLGTRYLNTLDYENAIAEFQTAIEISPKQPEAYAWLGNARYVQAEQVLLQASGASSVSKIDFSSLDQDVLQSASDYYQQALEAYENAADLDPENEELKEASAATNDALKQSEKDLQESSASEETTDTDSNNTELLTVTMTNDVKQIWGYSDDEYAGLYHRYYQYQKVELEESTAYPLLADRINTINQEMEEDRDTAYEADPKTDIDNYYNNYLGIASLLRGDSRVFSLFTFHGLNYYGDESSNYKFYNIDPKSGDDISLSDIINDLPSLAADICDAAYNSGIYSTNPVSESSVQALIDSDSLLWGIGYDGLTVLLKEYSYQPIMIPFEKYPGLISTSWRTDADEYAYQMVPYYTYQEDLDGDGNAEGISVGISNDSSDNYDPLDSITVTIDGTASTLSLSNESYSYDGTPYFVHTKSGNCYLYVTLTGDDLWGQMDIYRLTGDSVSYTGMTEDRVDSAFGPYFFANPSHFQMMTNTLQMLGTYEATRYCYIGSDGMPVGETNDYSCEGYWNMIATKQNVPAERILSEPDGVSSGSTTIPSGTGLSFLRTDSKTYVDLMDESGTIYRVYEDTEEWPYTVSNVDESDLFYGIQHAG